jgi:hypothetical protein
MHLQSSPFTTVVFIALGFASENQLASNLVKKSLTNIKPNLVDSADAIHELVRRDAQTSMECNVTYNCPTAGQGISLYQVTGKLQQYQNQAGRLSFPRKGGWVEPIADKYISIFPDSFTVGWTALKEKMFTREDTVCLITWTWSVKADMPNPNTLTLSDLNTHQVEESCGKRCSPITTEFCTIDPATGCRVI